MNAARGLKKSAFMPRLACSASFWMTQELDASLPAAGIVRTAAMGRASVGWTGFGRRKKSQASPS